MTYDAHRKDDAYADGGPDDRGHSVGWCPPALRRTGMPRKLPPPAEVLRRGDPSAGRADAAADAGRVRRPGAPARRRASRCAMRSSAGAPGSMIFWGPPGSGKTTLAHLVASTPAGSSSRSARSPRACRASARSSARRGSGCESGGAQTILFVDEIHRLNKAQQDSLLPPVGGRHHHPHRRHHREPQLRGHRRAALPHPGLRAPAARGRRHRASCCERALADAERGLGAARSSRWMTTRSTLMAVEADGDARRALTVLEAAAAHVGERGR